VELSYASIQLDASIVPNSDDQNVYLFVDDFGRNGRAWREANVEATDLETVLLDLLEGMPKYSHFWETAAGDWVRSLLRGRVCSATRQILRSALRSPADE
jgi:hypothetical protein